MTKKDPYLDDFTSKTRDDLADEQNKAHLAFYQLKQATAVVIPWPITQGTLNAINKLYEPIRFRMATDMDLDHNSVKCNPNNPAAVIAHPIAKSSELIIRLIHDTLPDATEIGTNLQGQIPGRHFCTLLDSRDSSRLHSKLALTQDEVVNDLVKGISKRTCGADARLCEIRAGLLFMSHVYSLSTTDFAKIMYNKGANAAKVCMFLPRTLALGFDHDIEGTDISVTFKGGEVYMHFKDCENLAYAESQSKWMSWFDTPAVNYRGEAFIFEIEKRFGPLAVIKVTRTTEKGKFTVVYQDPRAHLVPILDITNAKQIFDLCDMCPYEQVKSTVKYFYVPKSIYDSVVTHSNTKADRLWDRQTLSTYLRSNTFKITIGGENLQEGFRISGQDFHKIASSLYVESSIRRQMDTKEIGHCITEIKSDKSEFWHAMARFFLSRLFKNLGLSGGYSLFLSRRVRNFTRLILDKDIPRNIVTKEADPSALTHSSESKTEHYVAEDGKCLARCISKVVYGDEHMTNKVHTLLKGDVQLAYKNYPGAMDHIEIYNEHARILSTAPLCSHGIGFSIVNTQKQRHYSNMHEMNNRAIASGSEDNDVLHKAKLLLSRTCGVKKHKLHVLCGSPGMDLTVLKKKFHVFYNRTDLETVKWDDVNTTKGINILCGKCMPETGIVYADFGLPYTEGLPYMQYRAIVNLINRHKPFMMKLQNFTESLARGLRYAKKILDLDVNLYVNDRNPSEYFVDNMHKITCCILSRAKAKNNDKSRIREAMKGDKKIGPKKYFFKQDGVAIKCALDEHCMLKGCPENKPCPIRHKLTVLNPRQNLWSNTAKILESSKAKASPEHIAMVGKKARGVTVTCKKHDFNNQCIVSGCQLKLSIKKRVPKTKNRTVFEEKPVAQPRTIFLDQAGKDNKKNDKCGAKMIVNPIPKPRRTFLAEQENTESHENDSIPEVLPAPLVEPESDQNTKGEDQKSFSIEEVGEPKLGYSECSNLTANEISNACDRLGVTPRNDIAMEGDIVVLNVKGDGNCFWRCISLYLTASEENYEAIKAKVANSIPVNQAVRNAFAERESIASLSKFIKYDILVKLGPNSGIEENVGEFGGNRIVLSLENQHFRLVKYAEKQTPPGLLFTDKKIVVSGQSGTIVRFDRNRRKNANESNDKSVRISRDDCLACDSLLVRSDPPERPVPIGKTRMVIAEKEAKGAMQEFSDALITKNEKYVKIHEAALKILKGIKPCDVDCTVKGWRGYAGSGKTTRVCAEYKPQDCLVVVPTGNLRQDYQDKGFTATTFASFVANLDNSKKLTNTNFTLILDEIFLFHPGFIAMIGVLKTIKRITCPVVVIGDPQQNVWGSAETETKYTITKFLDMDQLGQLNVSYSVPQDVAMTLRCSDKLDYNYYIKTCSKVAKSIFYMGPHVPKGVDFICFTRTVRHLNLKHAVTAVQAQGSRKKVVNLYIESGAEKLVKSCPQMMLVALTRHTQRLNIYCSNEAWRERLGVVTGNFDHICSRTKIQHAGGARLCGGARDLHNIRGIRSQFSEVKFGVEPKSTWQRKKRENAIKLQSVFDPFITTNKVHIDNKGVLVDDYHGEDELKSTELVTAEKEIVDMVDISEADEDTELLNNFKEKSVKIAEVLNEKVENMKDRFIPSEGFTPFGNFERGVDVQFSKDVEVSISHFTRQPFDVSDPVDFCKDSYRFDEHHNEYEFGVDNLNTPFQVVNDFLDQVSPSNYPDGTPFYGTHDHALPMPKSDMLIKGNIEPGSDQSINVKRFKGPLRGRPIYAADDNQKLHTLITRGATVNSQLDEYKEEIIGKMINAYKKHIKAPVMVTEEQLMISIAEQMDRINAKGDVDQAAIFDPYVLSNSQKIKCFIKQQVKADLKEDSWLRYDDGEFKAGQGISAQPKAVNLLVGGIVRATEKAFMASLPEYISLCYGISVTELHSRTVSMLRGCDERQCMAFDISQFDTIHGQWSREFMHFLFDIHKVDNSIYKLMDELNIDWILDAASIKLAVHERMQSGRADTLFKNTVVALFLNLAFLDIRKPRMVLAQGDDVTIIADRIQADIPPFLMPYLKVDDNPIPECVGYLIGNYLTLDLGKMCVKLVNRNFYAIDPRDIDRKIVEYQQAIKDRLVILRDADLRRHCVVANAKHYQVPALRMEAVLSFLYAFAYGDPKRFVHDMETTLASSFTRKAK